jgi:POT family proton-dependent oligopeptide transporter
VCGTLGQKLGWHYGFGAAGVGMAVGLVIYLWGQRFLPKAALEASQKQEKRKEPLSDKEKKVILALVVLCALNIIFWGAYEQQGNTMQLWADKNTDWNLLGWTVPSSWFQSFNPFFIFLLAPFMDRFWAHQNKRNKEPSSVTKMAIGCAFLGVAFVVMIVGAGMIGEGRGSVLWLVACTFILTIGELYLSPIGLSLVSKVAPHGFGSMLMGMWFLSSFFGNYMSGFLGTFYETMSKQAFFGMLSALGFVAALAFLAFNKPLRRAIGGEHSPSSEASAAGPASSVV